MARGKHSASTRQDGRQHFFGGRAKPNKQKESHAEWIAQQRRSARFGPSTKASSLSASSTRLTPERAALENALFQPAPELKQGKLLAATRQPLSGAGMIFQFFILVNKTSAQASDLQRKMKNLRQNKGVNIEALAVLKGLFMALNLSVKIMQAQARKKSGVSIEVLDANVGKLNAGVDQGTTGARMAIGSGKR